MDEIGKISRVLTRDLISSMALRDLVHAIEPSPPEEVLAAADKLKYRDFLIVTLVLDRSDPFDDQWIYVHSGDVKVGRIQNFRAWSPEMLPNDHQASVGMEYFCQEGDGLWISDDEKLRQLAAEELVTLGLSDASDIVDGFVIRQPKAYPVYDTEYREAVGTVAAWVETIENLQCVGRNGQHRYNNQDHSMLTAMLAARNVLGDDHDVWSVNVERSYHEEFELPKRGDRTQERD